MQPNKYIWRTVKVYALMVIEIELGLLLLIFIAFLQLLLSLNCLTLIPVGPIY